MRRHLVVMALATTSIVLIALLLPMALLIQRFALEDALAAASLEVQATESVVAFQERADLSTFIDDLNDNDDGTRTTVLFADGDSLGPDPHVTADVQTARTSGQAITSSTSEGAEILVPVSVPLPDRAAPDDPPQGAAADASVIRVVITDGRFTGDVVVAWAIIAGLGLGLLALAVFVADRLGRNLVGPVTELANTAELLESGQLKARVRAGGPSEIREVGHALNRLAGRIGELLAAEREAVADISHRLRTPVTVLRLEVDELHEPQERDRLAAGVDTLAHAVDSVIREARRPMREGIGAASDARNVVRERSAFWSALADEQGRTMDVTLPPGPVLVKSHHDDLTAAVNALLENVFSHTDDGVDFAVTVRQALDGGGVITVTDRGSGIPDRSSLQRGKSHSGSTGLGLDIARRTAEAAGGRLVVRTPTAGGTCIQMELGAPAEGHSEHTVNRQQTRR